MRDLHSADKDLKGTHPKDDSDLINVNIEIIDKLLILDKLQDDSIILLKEFSNNFRALLWEMKNPSTIRNEFGFYDHSKNKKKRPHGIDFESYGKLEFILSDSSFLPFYTENFTDIKDSLRIFRNKLLWTKGKFAADIAKFSEPTFLDKITAYCVDVLTLKDILHNFGQLESFIFDYLSGTTLPCEERINQYCKLHFLSKIGEASKRIYDSDFTNPLAGEGLKIIHSLKKFRNEIKVVISNPWQKSKFSLANQKAEEYVSKLSELKSEFTKLLDAMQSALPGLDPSYDVKTATQNILRLYQRDKKINLGTVFNVKSKKDAKVVVIEDPKLLFARSLKGLVKFSGYSNCNPKFLDLYQKNRGLFLEAYPEESFYAPEAIKFFDLDSTMQIQIINYHNLLLKQKISTDPKSAEIESEEKAKLPLKKDAKKKSEGCSVDELVEAMSSEVVFLSTLYQIEPKNIAIKAAISNSVAIVGSLASKVNYRTNKDFCLEFSSRFCKKDTEWFKSLSIIERYRNKSLMHQEAIFSIDESIDYGNDHLIALSKTFEAASIVRYYENEFVANIPQEKRLSINIIINHKKMPDLTSHFLIDVALAYELLHLRDKALDIYEEMLSNKLYQVSFEGFLHSSMHLIKLYAESSQADKLIERSNIFIDVFWNLLEDKSFVCNVPFIAIFNLLNFSAAQARIFGDNDSEALFIRYIGIFKTRLERRVIEYAKAKEDESLVHGTTISHSPKSIDRTSKMTDSSRIFINQFESFCENIEEVISKKGILYTISMLDSLEKEIKTRRGEIRALKQNDIIFLDAMILVAKGDIQYFGEGDLTDAIKYYTQAKTLYENTYGDKCTHQKYKDILKAITSCYLQTNNLDGAELMANNILSKINHLPNKTITNDYVIANSYLAQIRMIKVRNNTELSKVDIQRLLEEAFVYSSEAYNNVFLMPSRNLYNDIYAVAPIHLRVVTKLGCIEKFDFSKLSYLKADLQIKLLIKFCYSIIESLDIRDRDAIFLAYENKLLDKLKTIFSQTKQLIKSLDTSSADAAKMKKDLEYEILNIEQKMQIYESLKIAIDTKDSTLKVYLTLPSLPIHSDTAPKKTTFAEKELEEKIKKLLFSSKKSNSTGKLRFDFKGVSKTSLETFFITKFPTLNIKVNKLSSDRGTSILLDAGEFETLKNALLPSEIKISLKK